MSDTPDDQPEDFATLFAAYEREQEQASKRKKEKGAGEERGTKRGPQAGDKLSGRIVSFGEESAFVDLGGKSEGVIPLAELLDADGQRTVNVGDEVEAVVVGTGDDGVVLRVRGGGRGQAAPAELAQAHAHGLPVEGTVTAVIKGGVEVTVAGVRAFCPISQLDDRYVADAASFVGQRLSFRITRMEEGRGRGINMVLSRRTLLEEEKAVRAEAARAQLAPGKVVRGTVTSLAAYGAFVDLGGIEGLLHVSQLGHARVAHPQDVLAVGQEVEVQVLDIKTDAKGEERISLSRRALVRDPWHDEAARLKPGTRRTGRVARLETFGAFVELAPGVDGLLHVSELGGGKPIRHPREAVKAGDTIEVAVKSVDVERRRIALTLAAAADEAEASAAEAPPEPPGFGALGDFFSRGKKKG
ncbi:MAG TPA: S1 RNA-binding domain-containing protein [Thermoanaerobaculia bacterium]|nr:S1 RNA-binding domain-containing protein [Thermoanaerobaculia bacterium]HXT49893.1 S1 RNA-binding domain-containing protein [Thermoanaerobaculia bacterium]